MSEPTVDREAWSRVVADLIRQETKGNKSEFMRRIGVKTVKTIDRWLGKEVKVSADSVRQVAQAVGLPEIDLLRQVGYIQDIDEDRERLLRQGIAENRRAIAWLRDQPDLPPSVRKQIEDSLLETIAEQEASLEAMAKRMVDLARKTGGAA